MNEQSPEYVIWQGMIDRCATKYSHRNVLKADGTRGVQVCERWRDSFDNFLADMGPRPSPDHLFGRVQRDVDYTPKNCRWESHSSDVTNGTIRFRGETRSVEEWAERLNIDARSLRMRLRRGWTMEQALTIPQGGSRERSAARAKPAPKLTLCEPE
jgi:hypothetical protein